MELSEELGCGSVKYAEGRGGCRDKDLEIKDGMADSGHFKSHRRWEEGVRGARRLTGESLGVRS